MDLRKKLHVDLYKHPLIGGENKDGYYYPPHWLKGDQLRFRNRELYSTLDSLDAVIGYMVACDFTDGGWYALAYQAKEIMQINQQLQSITNCLQTIASILSTTECEPDTFVKTVAACRDTEEKIIKEMSLYPNDEFISLYEACANWQREAMAGTFDLTFNPWQIRNWMKEDETGFLNGTYRFDTSSAGRRINCFVKKEGFLEKFVEYRMLSSQRHPRHFKPYQLNAFITWRKNREQKAA